MTSKLINLSSMCIISLIRPHFQLPKIDIASGWSFLRVWESMTIAFFCCCCYCFCLLGEQINFTVQQSPNVYKSTNTQQIHVYNLKASNTSPNALHIFILPKSLLNLLKQSPRCILVSYIHYCYSFIVKYVQELYI